MPGRSSNPMIVRELGRQPYESVWRAMQSFTDTREKDTPDELWLVEHDPVYTLGQAGRREHLHAPEQVQSAGGLVPLDEIPVVQSDRGGQVTYHGPGQLVAYTLLDLRRLRLGIRELVIRLENAVIAVLATYDVVGEGRRDMPGVYVGEQKIAALGLRVRKGCSFHGLALNVDMDLAPFQGIDPCGFRELQVTSLAEQGAGCSLEQVKERMVAALGTELGSSPVWAADTSQ